MHLTLLSPLPLLKALSGTSILTIDPSGYISKSQEDEVLLASPLLPNYLVLTHLPLV
jgi:hypothetical protein